MPPKQTEIGDRLKAAREKLGPLTVRSRRKVERQPPVPTKMGARINASPKASTSSTSKPSSKEPGSDRSPVPKFTKTVTFTVKAKGDTALALQALAFVAGRSLEFIALDALAGIDDRAKSIAAIHCDTSNIVEL